VIGFRLLLTLFILWPPPDADCVAVGDPEPIIDCLVILKLDGLNIDTEAYLCWWTPRWQQSSPMSEKQKDFELYPT
jgi:hypothetical protein